MKEKKFFFSFLIEFTFIGDISVFGEVISRFFFTILMYISILIK